MGVFYAEDVVLVSIQSSFADYKRANADDYNAIIGCVHPVSTQICAITLADQDIVRAHAFLSLSFL